MIGELLYASQQRRESLDQRDGIAAAGQSGDQRSDSEMELLEEIRGMRKDQQKTNERMKILEQRVESIERSDYMADGVQMELLDETGKMKDDRQETNGRMKELEEKTEAIEKSTMLIFEGVLKLEKKLEAMHLTLEEVLKRSQPLPQSPATTFLLQGARPKTFTPNGSGWPGSAHMIPTSMNGCHPGGGGDGNWCFGDTRTTSTIVQTQPSASHQNVASVPSPTHPIVQPLMPQTSGSQQLAEYNHQNGSNSGSAAVAVPPPPNPSSTVSFSDPGMLQAIKNFISENCDSSGLVRLTLEQASSTSYQRSAIVLDDMGQWHVAYSGEKHSGQLVPFVTQPSSSVRPNAAVESTPIQNIPNCPSNNVLTEHHMFELSGMFGTNWRRIGVQCLKFSWDSLSIIKENHSTLEDAIFVMIKQWQRKNGNSGEGNIPHLIEVLSKSNHVDPGVIKFLKLLMK